MNEFYVGQKLLNSPFDEKPSFSIVRIFQRLGNDDTTFYEVKNIENGKTQVTTEDFLYPCN